MANNKPASAYAKPHAMSGRGLTINELEASRAGGKNHSKLDTYDVSVGNISKSAGNEPIKTNGVKVRGGKAQTKGMYARGPMA
jgi:hypothetical protein